MIDVKSWKSIKLSDYFDICAGIYHYPDEYSEGNTPYITASNTDNGTAQYIDLEPDFEGNCIVTGKIGCTAFYQPKAFCATSDVNIFKPLFHMTPKIALFLVTIINFNENYRWSYGRQCRVGNSKKIELRLPVDSDNEPNWEFMESYIDNLNSLKFSTHIQSSNLLLDVKSWSSFKLKDLFDIKYGVNLELNSLDETHEFDPSGVAFVSRTSQNNGVSSYVNRLKHVELQPKGVLTVAGGGSVLSTFLQFRDFYSGRDLYVLYDYDRYKNKITNFAKLFIKTVIEKEQYRYNYGRQANRTLGEIQIKLPAIRCQDNKFEPDWEWMDQYMKSLPFSDKLINVFTTL